MKPISFGRASVSLFAVACLAVGAATGYGQSASSNSGSGGNGSGATGTGSQRDNAGTTGSGAPDRPAGSTYGMPGSATSRGTPNAQMVPGARNMSNSGVPSNKTGVQPVKGVDTGATTTDSNDRNTADGTSENKAQNIPAGAGSGSEGQAGGVDRNDENVGKAAGPGATGAGNVGGSNAQRATGTSNTATDQPRGTNAGTVGGSAPGTSGSGVGRNEAPATGPAVNTTSPNTSGSNTGAGGATAGAAGGGGKAGGNNQTTTSSGSQAKGQYDVVDVALSEGQFGTFMKALRQANLVDTLKGQGPYTILAPTDAAFAKIPQQRLEKLLADRTALLELLKHHVIAGKVTTSELTRIPNQQPLVGSSLKVKREGKGVKIEDANVVLPDIEASNGVIHSIDAVLIPATVRARLTM